MQGASRRKEERGEWEERGEEEGKTRLLTRVGAAISEYEHVYQRGGLPEASAMLNEPAFWLVPAPYCALSHSAVSSPLHPSLFILRFHPFTLSLSSFLSVHPLLLRHIHVYVHLRPNHRCPKFPLSFSPILSSSTIFIRKPVLVQAVAAWFSRSCSPCYVLSVRFTATAYTVCSLFVWLWFTLRWSLPLPAPCVRPSQSDTKARQYLDQACFAPCEVSWAAFARANQKASWYPGVAMATLSSLDRRRHRRRRRAAGSLHSLRAAPLVHNLCLAPLSRFESHSLFSLPSSPPISRKITGKTKENVERFAGYP